MSISEALRNWFLEPVLHKLKQTEEHMSALDDKTAAIVAGLATLKTDLEAAIADLKSKIGSGEPTADQLAALDAIAASIGSLDAEAKAE